MRLWSPAFADGGRIPAEHATRRVPGGRNTSVPLTWDDPPAGTRSFALTVVDLHPVAHGWAHWVVAGIPSDARGLDAGASGTSMPDGVVELPNTYGTPGWGGMQPPAGSGDHRYEMTLYALDVGLEDLPAADGLPALERAMTGRVLATAKLTGVFSQ